MSMKDEWRCAMMESGRLFVIECGVRKKLRSSVDSSTTQILQVIIMAQNHFINSNCCYNLLDATYVRRGCAGQGREDQDTVRVVWRCSGEELKLLDCNRINTSAPCDHRRDAGVYCSGK